MCPKELLLIYTLSLHQYATRRVEGQPWVPVGSTVGPRFLAGIRGSPQKIRQRWVPVAPVLAKNRHINHTGKPSVNEGFCKTATVRTIAFRGQLIANHCSLLVCTRVSTLRTIAVSCAYQNPQKCAHARNTLETPCRPKQWGAVPDLHLGWVSSARVLQLRARHRT